MNKRNKERIAFTIQQAFNMQIMNEDNPMEYDEGFIEFVKARKFTFRNRITNACCKLNQPITTADIGKVFNEQFEIFKKEYEEEIK